MSLICRYCEFSLLNLLRNCVYTTIHWNFNFRISTSLRIIQRTFKFLLYFTLLIWILIDKRRLLRLKTTFCRTIWLGLHFICLILLLSNRNQSIEYKYQAYLKSKHNYIINNRCYCVFSTLKLWTESHNHYWYLSDNSKPRCSCIQKKCLINYCNICKLLHHFYYSS